MSRHAKATGKPSFGNLAKIEKQLAGETVIDLFLRRITRSFSKSDWNACVALVIDAASKHEEAGLSRRQVEIITGASASKANTSLTKLWRKNIAGRRAKQRKSKKGSVTYLYYLHHPLRKH